MSQTTETTPYPWQTLFASCAGPYYGYVGDIDTATKIITLFSYTTGTSYAVTRASKDFGNFNIMDSGSAVHTIRFEDDGRIKHGTKINVNGCPFMQVGVKLMECHQGPCRHRQQPTSNMSFDHSYEQKRKAQRTSKKNGCSAAIYLRELVTFPQYKIETYPNQYRKRKIEKSEQLRADMQSTNYEDIETEKLIFIDLPSPSKHTGHATGNAADVKAPIDRQVVTYINTMVDAGITNVAAMKHHVTTYVNNLFESNELPSIVTRKFFPSREDVRKLIFRRCRFNREASMDQETSQNNSTSSDCEGDATSPSVEQPVISLVTAIPDNISPSTGDTERLGALHLDRSIKQCREVLTKITDLTSTVNSVCALEKAAEDLDMIYRSLRSYLPTVQTPKHRKGNLKVESIVVIKSPKRTRSLVGSRRKQTANGADVREVDSGSTHPVAMETSVTATPEVMTLGVSSSAGGSKTPVQLQRGIWYYVDGHHNVLSLENNWLTDKVATSQDLPFGHGPMAVTCQDPASSQGPIIATIQDPQTSHGPMIATIQDPVSSHGPVDEAQTAVKHITRLTDTEAPTCIQEQAVHNMTNV